MKLEILEIPPDRLAEYASVPSALEVRSILQVELIQGGLGGMRLQEVSVNPYIKDYDAHGETVVDWPRKFDVRNWGFFLARWGDETAGAAAVAFDTTGRNLILAPDAAALDDAPARRFQRGINVFCSCFGFVHGRVAAELLFLFCHV
jgi:hypothetical protein